MSDKGAISVLAAPSIDPGINRKDMTVPQGLTIAQIAALALPNATDGDLMAARVVLVTDRGSAVILQERWGAVRPRPGVCLVIRLIPGKNALRSILTLVVTVAAYALGQFWAGAGGLGLTAGTPGFAMASGAISMGIPLVGGVTFDLLCGVRR